MRTQRLLHVRQHARHLLQLDDLHPDPIDRPARLVCVRVVGELDVRLSLGWVGDARKEIALGYLERG